MRTPELSLKDLLFDFDCVTIPGFGGFIMQSQPSMIDDARHRIFPSSRVPSFNSLLNHDDGLLISRISTENNLTYKEAAGIVAGFTSDLKSKLDSGETIELDGIGTFRKGMSSEIVFKSDYQANFSAGTFGLEPLNLYSVNSQVKPPSTRDFRPARTTAEQYRHRNPKSVRWTLAISLPVIAFLLYGIIFPNSIQTMYTNYSGIIADFLTAKKISSIPEIKTTETTVTMPAPVEVLKEEIKPNQEVIGSEEIKADTKSSSADQAKSRFYIIGGCFEKEENAEKFLEQLLKKGYEAEKAGVTKKGHTRISYKSFTEKDPALSFLQKIKDEENSGAWLLKY